MAFPAQHLKILKRVILLLKVNVMRIPTRRAAHLAQAARAFPCKRLHLLRPTTRIRNLSAAIFPHRILFTRRAATQTPFRVKRPFQATQTGSLTHFRSPCLTNLLCNSRKTSASRIILLLPRLTFAHCLFPLRTPYIRRLPDARLRHMATPLRVSVTTLNTPRRLTMHRLTTYRARLLVLCHT